jgi:hypothetical protein
MKIITVWRRVRTLAPYPCEQQKETEGQPGAWRKEVQRGLVLKDGSSDVRLATLFCMRIVVVDLLCGLAVRVPGYITEM